MYIFSELTFLAWDVAEGGGWFGGCISDEGPCWFQQDLTVEPGLGNFPPGSFF